MTDTVLELTGVTKRFGDFTAVDSMSFSVAKGSIVGFLGPNGAGKTTTLRMMLGIIPPDAGTIRILGHETIDPVRTRLGYLPEERGLYKRMRAVESVAYIARLKGMDKGAARLRAQELLAAFGLGDFARTRVENLSKGMAQKVQLAATIAHRPELVILDEPFSGLDPLNQQVLESLIRDLAARGCTILFSTHTMEHAERLCDRFVMMTKGRKVFDGDLAEARARMPRRARIASEADLGFLSGVAGVERVTPPATDRDAWDIALSHGADGRALLAACFSHGVALTRFDVSEPSLHDVFVALAGGAELQP